MEFENLKQSFVVSEKDSERYIIELWDIIWGIYSGANFKGRNLHEEVQKDIIKYIKGKYEKEVQFKYQHPKNGIGNNWQRGIYVLDENKEIYLGNLHITNNMYGKELIFFSTTNENVETDVIEVRIR